MRKIARIFVHCSDTPNNRDIGAKEIRDWHINGNGWSDIGYHYVIRRDGSVDLGREESVPGAHCKGHNHDSIGICLVGGRLPEGGYRVSECNYTLAQMRTLEAMVKGLVDKYPGSTVHGHREFDKKECPCFHVDKWWDRICSEK